MSKNVYAAGVVAGVIVLIVSGLFETNGAWGLLLNLTGNPAGRWLVGITASVVLVTLYEYLDLSKSLPGDSKIRGALYGLLVWVATLIVGLVIPAVGSYTYQTPQMSTLVLTAAVFLIWGFTFGAVLEER